MRFGDIYILGINENHDSSAVLMKNGIILCAVSQERVTRVKHHGYSIQAAVEYVLNSCGLKESDLTCVVSCIHGSDVLEGNEEEKLYKSYLKENSKLFYTHYSHHDLHAYSALYTSGIERGAILVCDGIGSRIADVLPHRENCNYFFNHHMGIDISSYHEGESLYEYNAGVLKCLFQKLSTHYPYNYDMEDISLGRLYSYLSKHVFSSRYDAGKVMALAGYGNYTSQKSFLKKIEHHYYVESKELHRLPKNNMSTNDYFANIKKNIACRIQEDVVKACINLAEIASSNTSAKVLCLSGGVALNCQANYEIAKKGIFESISVVPGATDDGIAIGAAYYGHVNCFKGKLISSPKVFFNPYLGKSYNSNDIIKALNYLYKSNISFGVYDFGSRLIDRNKQIAKYLKTGRIVGLFQGGSEFGPRALGNRSIIANPAINGIKDRINKTIKEREHYRPLAPSVLAEYVSDYFDVPVNFESPYMLFAVPANKKCQQLFPEILHIDCSARLQTVTPEQNRQYYDIIYKFFSISGIPMVLNTSFNRRLEPIVETPIDAISVFIDKPIDVLVLDSFVVTKGEMIDD